MRTDAGIDALALLTLAALYNRAWILAGLCATFALCLAWRPRP